MEGGTVGGCPSMGGGAEVGGWVLDGVEGKEKEGALPVRGPVVFVGGLLSPSNGLIWVAFFR